MWVAAGNVATYEKAALHGLGVLGFNIANCEAMRGPVQAYKQAIREANPVGAYVHDNVMVASRMFLHESSERARLFSMRSVPSRRLSLHFGPRYLAMTSNYLKLCASWADGTRCAGWASHR